MSLISKLSDTSYKIRISEGDMTRAFPEDFTEIQGKALDNSSSKTVSASIEIVFDKDAADKIRKMVSSELTLGLNMGDKLNENKYLEALFCSPVPFAGIYGSLSPSLTADDGDPINSQLENLPVSMSVALAVEIGIGDSYRLKFIPDARGFDIILENVSIADNLEEDHAYALTVPFVISTLDMDNPLVEDGSPAETTLFSVDDSKVLFYEKDFNIKGGETLTRTFALSGFNDRGAIRDAYSALFSLSMWRSGEGSVGGINLEPFASVLCGVDPLGTSIQYLPLDGLTGWHQVGSGKYLVMGQTKVLFLVGDIRYPVKPFFGVSKTMFDVCTDDPGWSDVGPLASQYIGGEGVTGPNVIHSWTGRKSMRIRREDLEAIGQTKLGG